MKTDRVNLVALPMYLFLLFCVATFFWLFFTTHVKLTSTGRVVASLHGLAFLAALHFSLGARLIYQRRGFSADFRRFARAKKPSNAAARLPWTLARLGIFCWCLLATTTLLIAAGIGAGYLLP